MYLLLRGVAHFFISTNEMPVNKGKSKEDKEIELKQIGVLLKCFLHACSTSVPFKSKLTVTIRCESLFSTRFSIPAQIKNQELRTSYRELRGSSLVRQKTKDSPMSNFSLILKH